MDEHGYIYPKAQLQKDPREELTKTFAGSKP